MEIKEISTNELIEELKRRHSGVLLVLISAEGANSVIETKGSDMLVNAMESLFKLSSTGSSRQTIFGRFE